MFRFASLSMASGTALTDLEKIMLLLNEENRSEKVLDGKKGRTLFFDKLGFTKNKFIKMLLSNGISATAITALAVVGVNVSTTASTIGGFFGIGATAITVFNPLLFIPFAAAILAVFGIKILGDKKNEGIPSVTKGSSNIIYATGLHMVFLPAIAFIKEGAFSKSQENFKQIIKDDMSEWGTCEEYSDRFIKNYFSEDDLNGDLFKLKRTILDFQNKFKTKGQKKYLAKLMKDNKNSSAGKKILFSSDFNQNEFMQKARIYCEELNEKYGSPEIEKKNSNERIIFNIFNTLE